MHDAISVFSVTELPMQDNIVAKLLDFIAEPRAKDDSTLSDDQVNLWLQWVCTF
jgi:hypothetical protein